MWVADSSFSSGCPGLGLAERWSVSRRPVRCLLSSGFVVLLSEGVGGLSPTSRMGIADTNARDALTTASHRFCGIMNEKGLPCANTFRQVEKQSPTLYSVQNGLDEAGAKAHCSLTRPRHVVYRKPANQ